MDNEKKTKSAPSEQHRADAISRPEASDLANQLERFQERMELADPDAGLPIGDRLINKSIEAVGVACLAVIFVLILSSTLGRYVWNQPLIWGEEVVLGIIPWLVATGMFLSARRRRLVTVEFVSSRFSPQVARVVSIFGQLISLFVFSYIAVASYRYFSFFGRDPTPYLGVPKGLSTSAYIFCGGATAIAFGIALIRNLRTQVEGSTDR